ncbi:hypothetical protein GPECTOR_85g334 [Gonium pectorale]|uniref:Protein kinase domain-containing protein n=1 Tax=Gonium pectorale TaxID=33097 RepID=A0A150G1A4_GONPE|nr:hypothetical protein GPECTOR_85g334 [Gonium pectorale]|eukprot:KXZ43604.1 hypothetical protein GPECTOR_85g334 [Gonium pectorale]
MCASEHRLGIAQGTYLAIALADSTVDTGILTTDIVLQDSDWYGFELPIPLERNFTLLGQRSDADGARPALDFVTQKDKVRLGNFVTLTMRHIALVNFTGGNYNMAPGVDLLAHGLPGDRGMLVTTDCIGLLKLCYPADMQEQVVAITPRPSWMPGQQKIQSGLPQPGCVNVSDLDSAAAAAVPPDRRCWPQVGLFEDTALLAFDLDANQKQIYKGYATHIVETFYACAGVLTRSCVEELGTVGCITAMLRGAVPPVLAPPPEPSAFNQTTGGSDWATASSGLTRGSDGLRVVMSGDLENGPGGAAAAPAISVQLGACSPQLPQTMSYRAAAPSRQHVELHTDTITPLTPQRPEVVMDARPGHEVTLLPEVLGKGSYGRVVAGMYQGQPVAVKILLDSSLAAWGMSAQPKASTAAVGSETGEAAAGEPAAGDKEDGADAGERRLTENLGQEVAVLGRCRHRNVVTLLAACLEPPRYCLVMERMETSLDKLIYGRPGQLLPLDDVLTIALDVARGLEYLHPTIVHRDLKPGNVLIDNPNSPRLVAKLSDFGLSRLRSTAVPTANPEDGTPEYMAPEQYATGNFIITHKADVYSFGVLLWAMLSGCRPWKDMPMVAIASSVALYNKRPPLQAIPAKRLPHKLQRLIKACWDKDPLRRPAAADLVKELMLAKEQVGGWVGV